MLIFSKVNSLDSIASIETLSLSNKLIEYVASKAGIPALGLWVLLCNQITTGSVDRRAFCQKYSLAEGAFDKTIVKLANLNLAWHEQDSGFEQDWFISNLPKAITTQTEQFLFQLENLFKNEDFGLGSVSNTQSFIDIEPIATVKIDNRYSWDKLALEPEFYNLAALKIPKELIEQYWDTFISSNDQKGEIVPARPVLYKKWKSYIANVSVNLAVSDRRFSNQMEQKAKKYTLTEQKNIEAWQALLEQKIPQVQSFSAAMNNLSQVENDVWIGYIQQNIRYKNDPLNNTNLQYSFEEYCKTTGQKFLKKQSAPPKEIDNQLNDTSWANNLDDVL